MDHADHVEDDVSPALRETCEPEWLEWYRLTPQERWRESMRLFNLYRAFGGSLDSDEEIVEPDPPGPRTADQKRVT